MEEEEERDLAPRGERVLEQGTDRDLARPPLKEVQDKFNSTCRGCGITLGGRKQYLQHCQSAHSLPGPPGPLGPTGSPDPAPKGSPQKRGRSLPPTPGLEAQGLGRGAPGRRPGLAAHVQVGGRPTPQGMNSGAFRGLPVWAFRPPGPEGTTARPPHDCRTATRGKGQRGPAP